MRRHFVVGLAAVVAACLSSPNETAAQEFSLQVGLPIAGQSQSSKASLFVVRPGGCADPASARITATAEGVVNGRRRSMPLTLSPLPTPGVHALPKEWTSAGGVWVVSLVGTCAGKTAGALVPVERGPSFRRDAVKQLSHRATAEEIDASLKALTGGQR